MAGSSKKTALASPMREPVSVSRTVLSRGVPSGLILLKEAVKSVGPPVGRGLPADFTFLEAGAASAFSFARKRRQKGFRHVRDEIGAASACAGAERAAFRATGAPGS